MSSFDFITSEAMRASLQSDMRELEESLTHGNLKAAHVLAGSVVEAILIDHLIVANIVTEDSGFKLDLAEAVKRCRENSIISQRTADMCSVVRSYRNLIHPGRVTRLKEKISAETAQVARALVGIVLDEVSSVRLKDYGPTAEQILSKLARDARVDVITPHLLKKAHKRELERLLTHVLPAAERTYSGFEEEPPPQHISASLTRCFRLAFELVDHEVKERVAARFASLLHSETDQAIRSYGDHFFLAGDIQYLSPDDAALVKDHLFGLLAESVSTFSLQRLSGIGRSLSVDDVPKILDPIVRAVTRDTRTVGLPEVVSFLRALHIATKAEIDEVIRRRLNSWRERVDEWGKPGPISALGEIRTIFEDDIPF